MRETTTIKTIMKSFKNALVLGALALAALTASVSAKEAGTYVTFPNTVRCQACGAEYHIRPVVTKNDIQLKAELISKTANPKTR